MPLLSQSRGQRPYLCLAPAFVSDGRGLFSPCRGNEATPGPQLLINLLLSHRGQCPFHPPHPHLHRGLWALRVCQGCHGIPCRSYKCAFIYTLTVARTATLI